MNIPLDPEVEQVLGWITAVGGRPMLDGGFVRDHLLGLRGSKDVDKEVYGVSDLDILHLAVRSCSVVTHVMEAGKVYGVLKVHTRGGLEIDVSLPRREVNTGVGHRGFTVLPDSTLGFEEATARRDFTINSILYDPATGEFIDCHDGIRDLKLGLLRHTSDRFGEDPLRVLRGVQFASRFGFTLAPETTNVCRRLVRDYKEISRERVWGEWEKIGTRGAYITHALFALQQTCWAGWYPELNNMRYVAQDPIWHPEGDVWVHAGLAGDQGARLADEAGLTGTDRLVIVFAALLHDLGKATHTQTNSVGRITSHGHAAAGREPARLFLNSIGCPREIKRRILPLVTEHMSTVQPPTKPACRRLVRRLEPATLTELHMVVGADRKGRGNPDAVNDADSWLEIGKDLTIAVQARRGLLTGKHLIDAGMTPGPEFKEILGAALQAQDDGDFETEVGAVQWANNYLAKVNRE